MRQQSEVTEEYLLSLQQAHAREYGKVDIYHIEEHRVIGIFPHNAHPIPPNAIRVIRY